MQEPDGGGEVEVPLLAGEERQEARGQGGRRRGGRRRCRVRGGGRWGGGCRATRATSAWEGSGGRGSQLLIRVGLELDPVLRTYSQQLPRQSPDKS